MESGGIEGRERIVELTELMVVMEPVSEREWIVVYLTFINGWESTRKSRAGCRRRPRIRAMSRCTRYWNARRGSEAFEM